MSQASPFLSELQFRVLSTAFDVTAATVKRKRPIVTGVEHVSPESVSTSRRSHQSNSQPALVSGTVNRNAGLSTELSSVFSRAVIDANSSESNAGANSRAVSSETASRSRPFAMDSAPESSSALRLLCQLPHHCAM